MLKNLSIKNIALISNLSVDLGENLCVLTGETGAGKSIIVDSLAFVLGGKADKSLIKFGEEKATVEAVFEVEENSVTLSVLKEFGFDDQDTTVVLFRAMNLQGKNECRINGRVCTLSVLKAVACTLVDIFGQSDHVNLLRTDTHLTIIDNFKKSPFEEELTAVVSQYKQLKNELSKFGGSEAERERTLDLLDYEIKEITRAELSENEEEELMATKDKVANVEKIAEALKGCLAHLNQSCNISSELWLASNSLQGVQKYDSDLDSVAARLQSAKYELDDLTEIIESKISECDYNPAQVDKIMERLDEIKRLKRKYGGTVTAVLDYLEQAKDKYGRLVDATAQIEEINGKMEQLKAKAYELSKKLSQFRKGSAEEFCELVKKELSDLGMKNATFSAVFSEEPSLESFLPSEKGFDSVEFMFSANKGEPQKPLAKVISGGEMSRFLLAVKNITAKIENIPTMVFDEIDIGLSGTVAQMVAIKLANVSRKYQCIVITHLPQVAAMGDNNYFINKFVENEKTVSQVTVADIELKTREVARLMGGENIGEYGIKHAGEMLNWADKIKASL